MAIASSTFLWTRERYDQAIEAGVFTTDDKVELLDGEVVAKTLQNEPHAVRTSLVADALRSAFRGEGHVREEKPIALTDLSEPEPDIAVVRGSARDYLSDHPGPGSVLVLIEVSDSSLSTDRTRKVALYADASAPEYWIVNLQDRVLEVYRDPAGGTYRTKTTLGLEDEISPVHAPDASIPVADLLP